MAEQNTFVLVAQVAASLHFSTKVAEQLSLTAKNAHAISARAGQQSAGFRAITSFIEELAAKTIERAGNINREAVSIVMLASDRERSSRALQQFDRAAEIAPDAAYLASIDTPRESTLRGLLVIDQQFAERLKKLHNELQDTQQQIRAAAIIASTSKVEATLAGSFQSQLEVIAQNITHSADQIRGHLRVAQQLLNIALDTI